MGKVEKLVELAQELKAEEEKVRVIRNAIQELMGIKEVPVVEVEVKRKRSKGWSKFARKSLAMRKAWRRKSAEERAKWTSNIRKGRGLQ